MEELVQPEHTYSPSVLCPKLCRQLWNIKKRFQKRTLVKYQISLLRPVSSMKCKNIAIALSASTTALQKSSSLYRMGGLHHLSPEHCREHNSSLCTFSGTQQQRVMSPALPLSGQMRANRIYQFITVLLLVLPRYNCTEFN